MTELSNGMPTILGEISNLHVYTFKLIVMNLQSWTQHGQATTVHIQTTVHTLRKWVNLTHLMSLQLLSQKMPTLKIQIDSLTQEWVIETLNYDSFAESQLGVSMTHSWVIESI